MGNRGAGAALLAAAITGGSPGRALGAEWSLATSQRFFTQSVPEDVLFALIRAPALTATTAAARTAYQMHLLGELKVRPFDALGLVLGVDSGLVEVSSEGALLDGRDLGTRAKETLFLGATYVDVELGETGVTEMRLGKLRPRIGDGVIFDAYGFGLMTDVDLGLADSENPWRFRAYVLLPDGTFTSTAKNSPLIDLEVGYQFARSSEVRLVGAVFLDQGGGMAPIFAHAVARGRAASLAAGIDRIILRTPEDRRARAREVLAPFAETTVRGYNAGLFGYDVETRGRVAWTGLLSKVEAGDLSLEGALLLELGRADLFVRANEGLSRFVNGAILRNEGLPPFVRTALADLILENGSEPQRVTMRSFFGSLEASYAVADPIAVEVFGIVMGGDDGLVRPETGEEAAYTSFVSLAPLLTYTSLFFHGGIASNLASPTVISIAPDGAGLLAGGAAVEVTLSSRVSARAVVAALNALVSSGQTQSRRYGIEADLGIRAEILDFLGFFTEAAVLLPGAYFGDLPMGFQVIAALELFLPP